MKRLAGITAAFAAIAAAMLAAQAQGPPPYNVEANYTKYESYITMRDGKRLFTSIYVPKDPQFICRGGPHHDFAHFRRMLTMEYLPNTLFAFIEGADSEFVMAAGIRQDEAAHPNCRHERRLRFQSTESSAGEEQNVVGDVQDPLAAGLEVAIGLRRGKGAKQKAIHRGFDVRPHRRCVDVARWRNRGDDAFEDHDFAQSFLTATRAAAPPPCPMSLGTHVRAPNRRRCLRRPGTATTRGRR